MVKLEWVNSDAEAQYRIGDAVLYGEYQWARDARNRILDNSELFSQSVAYNYLKSISQSHFHIDRDLLRKAVNRYVSANKPELPTDDEIVVHLRLGDAKAALISEVSMTNSLLRSIEFWGIKPQRITLVAAFHVGKSVLLPENRLMHERSYCRQSIFTVNLQRSISSSLRLTCEIRSSVNPDSDFSYLASAKYLILGNGGFSLAASLAGECSVCVPPWCSFNNGREGNFMTKEEYYALMAPRKPHEL